MEKTKVLFVDDDVTFGASIMLILEELGYEAYYQSSLTIIGEVVENINPDIIILDVEFGNKNSIDSVPEIKAAAINTPIIFVSSNIDDETIARAIDMGGVAYLKKPFKSKELIAHINRHARKADGFNLKFGEYTLNISDESLLFNDIIVKQLSQTEFKLLKLLVLNINTLVKHDVITHKIWGGDNASGHSISNFIVKLRSYLSKDPKIELVAVTKSGYKLISK